MGKEFGNLVVRGGLFYHGLSPLEQRAFTGAVLKGIPNLVRRFRLKVLLSAVPILSGYYVYVLTKERHHELTKKNPADFENDQ